MISKGVLAIILGGGRGTRLFPLTMMRAKPAVPVGGKFRLIDIPISNCINSGVGRIFIMTQYLSTSLNRHVSATYGGARLRSGFVDILPAVQTDKPIDYWFQGTADAIRKHLRTFMNYRFEHFLILSGDHLYIMDYNKFYRHHIEKDADVTVAVTPVSGEEAGEFGITKVDPDYKIADFAEKPKENNDLERLFMTDEQVKEYKLRDLSKRYLGSMGVYLFKKKALLKYLEDVSMLDFGKDIIPHAVTHISAYAYPFSDFWADIGTIPSYFQANLMLGYPNPPFTFYQKGAVIYSRPRFLPSTTVYDSNITNSTIAEGCNIDCSVLQGVMLGLRTQIQPACQLKDVVILGCDYYEDDDDYVNPEDNSVPLGIGRNCVIEKTIIDKNARIGEGVIIRNEARLENFDGENYFIRNGIVVIPKNSVIKPGTVI